MDTLAPIALVVLILLAVLGAAAGIVLTVGRTTSAQIRPTGRREPGLLRLTSDIHTGWEQTLIGLTRELRLPRQSDQIAYGELYLETDHEQRLLIRSRSEIGRGFIGVTDIQPGRGRTHVRYSILRLPGDDQVRGRVLELELRIITAVRRIDPDAVVQLTGTALRELETVDQTRTTEQDPLP